MNFFHPLGLLGLIGIIILIVIYLIKPNYQQKLLSTTFIWKRSLKYRRKRIPINKFRNLLILLCQILIITLAAILIAAPYLPNALDKNSNEKILILDASASMLAMQDTGETRFDQAVKEIRELGESVIDKNDRVTLILANQEAKAILSYTDDKQELNDTLDELIKKTPMLLPSGCTFGEADIDGAMAIAQDYLILNPVAEVQLYTGTQYKLTSDNKVVIKNVAKNVGDDREWNAAIVDVVVVFDEGFFRFDIHVASYNRDDDIVVNFKAFDVNDVYEGDAAKEGEPKEPLQPKEPLVAKCRDGATTVVSYHNLGIYSYSSIEISLDVNDSFTYDNTYHLQDGRKEKIKIIYVSPNQWQNVFFEKMMVALNAELGARWDIYYEVTSLDNLEKDSRILEKFDLYIIEHIMPSKIPTDGVVLLVNPAEVPSNLGIRIGSTEDRSTEKQEDCLLIAGENSELMNYIDPSMILVNSYRPILIDNDAEFAPLMYADSSDIVFAAKNTSASKIAVISFTSLFTDFTMTPCFPAMLYGIFDCMFPATVKQHVYDVGEAVVFDQEYTTLQEVKPTINISGGRAAQISTVTDGYDNIVHTVPGEYITEQSLLTHIIVKDGYFVKVSANQSNFAKVDAFRAPIVPEVDKNDLEIYIYFAAFLCALVFVERLLHVKDEF